VTVEPAATYFARIGEQHPADRPMGIYRRLHTSPPADEAFGRDERWRPTDALRRAELGSLDADFVPISPDAAHAVIDRWRQEWAAQPDVAQLDLDQARDYLREQLVGAASAAYPGVTPVVERDKGPLPADVMFDGGSGAFSAPITVAAGQRDADPARDVTAAARHLAGSGWAVTDISVEDGRYEAVASREGFAIAIRMFDDEGILRLSGETPAYRRRLGRWRRAEEA
jgi:hypothetical protein